MDLLPDSPVAFTPRKLQVHARPVITPDALDPFRNLLPRVGRRVDRQVPALAVAHQADRRIAKPRRLGQVVGRRLLSRHPGLKAHVEVFPPADQRIVRSPESNRHRSVRQVDAHRGKLHADVLVRQRDEVMHPKIPEPFRFCHGLEHLFPHLEGVPAAFHQQVNPLCLPNRPAPPVRHSVKIQIAQHAQQQSVDSVPGTHRKRNIPPPG